MRISDWSSDVCSSDLGFQRPQFRNAAGSECGGARYIRCRALRSRPPGRRERARLQPRSFPVSLVEDDDLARGGIKCLDYDRFILDGRRRAFENLHLGRKHFGVRSEERLVGKECVRPFRYRWSPYHKKKTKKRELRR